ncbi:glycerophosphodiester phosphodiesterase [uncultured Microbulbifer sp.]|uniref:glycerophosphodiester phosphodiesterase n=1 Tax=uncultured Microbulbifer sp. TaxID=348147 RepID=UPI0025F60240|nr:glycerophosphodiester phosphodiesterase [uncultured Microbulbifer sp.]
MNLKFSLPPRICAVLLLATGFSTTSAANASENHQPLVIAHRGASGYLPEHTLEAKALAYGMKADYIEQDLVLSKDDHLIVMHDIYLDDTTDVAARFPGRARDDGHFYVIDFTLEELKQLRVTSTFLPQTAGSPAKYPQRFPLWKSEFRLATFEEELELIQGLNHSLGYNTGIYPEIKKPYFHHREGRDIARRALEVLQQYGYTGPQHRVFLQSFDAEELQRIHREMMPAMHMALPLVQLIAETGWGEKLVERDGDWVNYDYDWMRTPAGLEKIAGYASGIGPWFPMLVEGKDNRIVATALTGSAQRLGLQVHPYTFRADPGQVPEVIGSFEQMLALFVDKVAVDGLFTDQPDRVRAFLLQRQRQAGEQARKAETAALLQPN